MKIKRTIKRCDKKLKKATCTSEALNAVVEAAAEISSVLASEISGFDMGKGTQIALSAAFEVMSRETEKKSGKGFSDFDKELKQVLVENIEEAEKEHDNDRP